MYFSVRNGEIRNDCYYLVYTTAIIIDAHTRFGTLAEHGRKKLAKMGFESPER